MLRSATPADLDFFYLLYMHPDINPFLLYEQMALTEFKPIFRDLLDKKVIYIYSSNGEPAGMFKLIPQQYRNSHIAYLGGVAMHPSFAGRGLGKAMLTEIIAMAKQKSIKRIELSTATHNKRAIQLYERVGFVQEGLMRNYTWLKSENRYLDEVLMAWVEI